MDAFDIVVAPEPADRSDPGCHGWCFGLPPGIAPAQWPLDPANGYPLVHGFTLLLPEDYRRHGPDLVALSFFGTPEDMEVGAGGLFAAEVLAAVTRPGAAEPGDADLRPFWQAARNAHPRLHRLEGIDGAPYAAVLLTSAEYHDPLCPPPVLEPNRYRDAINPPLWLAMGGAAGAVAGSGGDARLLKALGGQPEQGHAFNRALRLQRRADDPNVGKGPRERALTGETGYHDAFYEDGEGRHTRHAWAKRLAWMHLGGTMRPGQTIPSFSPYYVEFEQWLGGFNFADGTAQLDLETMAFNVMST